MENKGLKNLMTGDAQQISIVPVEGIEALKKERMGVLLEIGNAAMINDKDADYAIAISKGIDDINKQE